MARARASASARRARAASSGAPASARAAWLRSKSGTVQPKPRTGPDSVAPSRESRCQPVRSSGKPNHRPARCFSNPARRCSSRRARTSGRSADGVSGGRACSSGRKGLAASSRSGLHVRTAALARRTVASAWASWAWLRDQGRRLCLGRGPAEGHSRDENCRNAHVTRSTSDRTRPGAVRRSLRGRKPGTPLPARERAGSWAGLRCVGRAGDGGEAGRGPGRSPRAPRRTRARARRSGRQDSSVRRGQRRGAAQLHVPLAARAQRVIVGRRRCVVPVPRGSERVRGGGRRLVVIEDEVPGDEAGDGVRSQKAAECDRRDRAPRSHEPCWPKAGSRGKRASGSPG